MLPARLARRVSLVLFGCQAAGVVAVLLFELAGRRGSGTVAAWIALLPAVGVSMLVAAPFMALVAAAWGARAHRPGLMAYAAATVVLVVAGVVVAW
jgi:hypothetical protein